MSIKFFWESQAEEAVGMARGNIVGQGLFFGEVARAGEASLLEDRVMLGEMFCREITEHGVPLPDRAIRQACATARCLCLAGLQAARDAGTDAAALAGAGFASIKDFRPLIPGCASGDAGEEEVALHPSPPPIPYRSGSQSLRFPVGWPHTPGGAGRGLRRRAIWLVNPRDNRPAGG
ncbi:hypothetical protein [Dankookia sp. P2]|uniref:hypothetical protein n=1 Tax=Dankookia sp. P2 TaxID=3423955 RepID=UPI003D6702BE